MDGMSHGSMGGMSMGNGPGLFYIQKMYWAVIGSAIAAGAVVNILNRFLAYQRYVLAHPTRTLLISI